MRKEVMALTRRAEVAEEGQAASRREQRRNAERVASTIEAKARQVTEVKRGLVSSNELLKRSNTDLSARLTEAKSRAAKEAAAHDACTRISAPVVLSSWRTFFLPLFARFAARDEPK